MKASFKPLLIAVVLCGFVLSSSIHFSIARTGTQVTGIISQNTTWTNANSPYSLTGPVAVNEGVTLTIEPGTAINLNSYYIQVNGTLIAKGTNTSQIRFNGGYINFTTVSNSWNDQTGSGCIIENANVSLTKINIGDASPKISNNYIIGGIEVDNGSPIISNNNITTLGMGPIIDVEKGSPIIVDNTISTQRFETGNPDTDYGIYMAAPTGAYISDNTFGLFRVAGIEAGTGGTAIIQRNQIISGIEGGAQVIIQNNTIGKIRSPSSASTIVYNNIVGSGIYLTNSDNINATYNWWGTTDAAAINQSIYDFKNDFNLGNVTFVPFLTSPNPQATPNSNAPLPTLTPSPTLTASPTQTPSPTPSTPPTQSATNSPSPTPTLTPTSTSSPSIPEFSVWMILPFMVVASVFAVSLRRRGKKA